MRREAPSRSGTAPLIIGDILAPSRNCGCPIESRHRGSRASLAFLPVFFAPVVFADLRNRSAPPSGALQCLDDMVTGGRKHRRRGDRGGDRGTARQRAVVPRAFVAQELYRGSPADSPDVLAMRFANESSASLSRVGVRRGDAAGRSDARRMPSAANAGSPDAIAASTAHASIGTEIRTCKPVGSYFVSTVPRRPCTALIWISLEP